MTTAPAEADVAPHFTAEFLAAVPPPKVVAVLGGAAPGAPWVVEKVSSPGGAATQLVAVVRSAQGPKLSVHLVLEPGAGGRMQGLLIRPHLDTKPAASWDEVAAAVRDVAPEVNLLAAELDGKKCVPVSPASSIDPKKPLALGSAFKLYVLDALAAQIAAGKHRWDEPLAIQDALKSLPSGAMRDEPAGKTFSVQHFAEQMISVSDNTAADHLLALVGRSAVEAAVRATGHASPRRNLPFLSTAELFELKLLASPDERAAYVAADVAHRRRQLEALGKRGLAGAMDHAGAFKTPVSIDSIEWFASPEDLCTLMVDLHERAAAPATAPVGAILSVNPGIPDDAKQFSTIRFKGGSEPGVLDLTWLLQRARDGKWLFLSVGFNDTGKPLDESKGIAAAAMAREMLGR